jgi:hypothetical protein
MKAMEMKCSGKRDADFRRMRCVLACVGKDRMRPELQRVLVESAKGGVYVVGCDGKRLRRDLFNLKAEPGLYQIDINNSREIRLVPSKVILRYPNYRKVIPKCDGRDTYAVSGKGARFVMWVGAALGCYVDPMLMALGGDEKVEVFVKKTDAGDSPLVVRNEQSLLVVMPMTLDDGMAGVLDGMQLDRLRRQRKMAVAKPKPRPKAESAPWWSFRPVRREAA